MKGFLTALLGTALLFAGCGERPARAPHNGMRIVSIAPNTAEILYAIGLSNEVVGVSRYTTYPLDAAQKPSVGGTYDPNYEVIVTLQPDLVVGLDSQADIAGQLEQLGIPFLDVAHERIRDIMDSILIIGKACGAEQEAQELFQTLEKQLAGFSNAWKTDSPPRVLVCVGHDETLTRMYVAGTNTFYDDLIRLAGGTNACAGSGGYPEISPEGLAALHPDVVIDILPTLGNFSSNGWTRLQGERPRVRGAVTEGSGKPYRAVLMTNDYASIPGPRFIRLLNDFSKVIHE
ncbi:MAG: ABC transporter substrate-binding protein [Kiritimatiellales bacterium]